MSDRAPAPGTVLCIGEALVSLAPASGATLERAPTLLVSVGGAELNVAVHLARLGLRSRFAGMLGDDPWGRRVLATLVDEGVDVSAVAIDPTLRTGCYLKETTPTGVSVYYYRDQSAASALDRLPPGAHDGVSHVHLSGITPALSASCRLLVESELAHVDGRTTSFDINYRAALWGPEEGASVLLDMARRADFVFVGSDEAQVLWGCSAADQVRRLIGAPVELVVKDGPREAVAFGEEGRAAATPAPVDVIDVVGAGDAFAAGYLGTRLRHGSMSDALEAGHFLAAATILSTADHGTRSEDVPVGLGEGVAVRAGGAPGER